MTDFTRELMFGKRPIQRTNPKANQSKWYYLDPRGADTVTEMKQIDVQSENSPNPYANEIQNYLYNNDKNNYKTLYGNTPPPQHFQNSNVYQLKMPSQNNKQIALPDNSNDMLDFINNTYGTISNAYKGIKQEYLAPRTHKNRYHKKCTVSDVAYNTISNYQISPNQKLVENGNMISNYAVKKALSSIPVIGPYINGLVAGDHIGNGLSNFYNAINEANCFK